MHSILKYLTGYFCDGHVHFESKFYVVFCLIKIKINIDNKLTFRTNNQLTFANVKVCKLTVKIKLLKRRLKILFVYDFAKKLIRSKNQGPVIFADSTDFILLIFVFTLPEFENFI